MRSLLTLTIALFTWQASADLVVYTDRPVERVVEIGARFEKITGTKVTVLSNGYDFLRQRLELEYSNPDMVAHPADVIFVKDLVYLGEVAKNGWLTPMKSPAIEAAIPANLRDPQNLWTGITFRARTLIYDGNMDVSAINTYEDLADPQWAGTLCLAAASASYNKGLMAELVSIYGEEKTTEIAKGLVANQAIDPQVEDSSIIRSLDNGDCAMALINSYYLGVELFSNPSYAGRIKFLNQDKGGVFVNATGAGVSATSLNRPLAQQFVEFLVTEDIQKYMSEQEMTFPANPAVVPPAILAAWGNFVISPVNLSEAYENVQKGEAIMLEANWK